MSCPSCGAEHDPANGAFCDACGRFVGRPPRAVAADARRAADEDEGTRCPECGVLVFGDARCRQCGARVRSTDQDDEAARENRRRRVLRERERAAAAAAQAAVADAAPAAGAADAALEAAAYAAAADAAAAAAADAALDDAAAADAALDDDAAADAALVDDAAADAALEAALADYVATIDPDETGAAPADHDEPELIFHPPPADE